MLLSRVAACCTVLLVGCAVSRPPPRPALPSACHEPAGTSLMLETKPGSYDRYGFEVVVAPLERCERSAYIALTGSGRRRFVLHPDVPDCRGVPAPDDVCRLVQVGDFGHDVAVHLEKRGVQATGNGLGACGRIGTLADWNFSVSVADWRHADAAIDVVAERLRAWQMGDRFGVSVQPVGCAEIQ